MQINNVIAYQSYLKNITIKSKRPRNEKKKKKWSCKEEIMKMDGNGDIKERWIKKNNIEQYEEE